MCAVIPCYGTGIRLKALLQGLKDKVDAVVVVDDGSQPPLQLPDMDLTIDVHLVRLKRNQGVGAAIMAGYESAFRMGARWAVVLAGDGQMDPRDVPVVLEPVVTGQAEYCKGERFTHPDSTSIPRVRLWGNYGLTYLTRLISGYDRLLDAQCGFTAIDLRALFERVPTGLLYPRYGFPNDMLVMASVANMRLAQVQVRPVYEGQASGLKPLLALLTYPVILGRAFLIKIAFRIHDLVLWRGNADPDGHQFLPYW